ncbi:MAG: oligosaccharide flippase family protein, partial [Pirellulales bacterium]|nr:oligosaccharide flippase family protein [Pirellulales bacterium]
MSQADTKRLAIRGVAFSWIARMCSMLIAFVITPYLLAELGRPGYGIWSIIMSLASYYAISNLGMHAAIVRYVSRYHAQDDRTMMKRFVHTA